MSTIFDDVSVDLFSFQTLISQLIDSGWKPGKPPNILLSKIKSVSSDIISEFEGMGIYDLEDLENSESTFKDRGGVLFSNFDKIKNKAIQKSLKVNHIPIITLKLPHNYAVIGLVQHSSKFDFAMSWKGLLFSWKDIPNTRIPAFIKEFNGFIKYCNNPELITDIRTWSFTQFENIEPSDLSVFMSNYDVFGTISEYCSKLDQPRLVKIINNNEVIDLIYSIEYILWLANQIRLDNHPI